MRVHDVVRSKGLLLTLALITLPGCTKEPGSTVLTQGTLTVVCDEAVAPAMRRQVEEFQRQYPQARLEVRALEARAAIADFAADSARIIVTARRLNNDERKALTDANVNFEEYHVAQSAVALIANAENPATELTVGQADSIFAGLVRTWPGRGRRAAVDPVVGGPNASTNEVFRAAIMGGKGFGPSVFSRPSSSDLVEYVRTHKDALGIVGLAWLKGAVGDVSVISLSRPGIAADSTQKPGAAYSPAQAYVFKGYYPVSTPVYMYLRSASRDVALGFISFVMGVEGQKVFLNSGLVPVTMPVRLVQLTTDQVNKG